MRRLLFVTIAAACLFAVSPRAAGAAPTDDEAGLVARINTVRTSRGLVALEMHPELQAKAQAWAAHMAGADGLSHSVLEQGITADWAWLAENVGVGSTLDHAHETLLASGHHFGNIVGPTARHVGVGIAIAGDRVYIAEEFMQLRTATVTPIAAPAPAPVALAAPTPPPPAAKPVLDPTPAAPQAAPTPASIPVAASASLTAPLVDAAPPVTVPVVPSPAPTDPAPVSLLAPIDPAPRAVPAALATPIIGGAARPASDYAGSSRAAIAWLAGGIHLLVGGNVVGWSRRIDTSRPAPS